MSCWRTLLLVTGLCHLPIQNVGGEDRPGNPKAVVAPDHVEVDETGKPKVSGYFKDGKKHGKWTYWVRVRLPKVHVLLTRRDCYYKEGKPHGVWTTWHVGKTKTEETPYRNGLIHGTQTLWYRSGKKKRTMQYVNGVRTGVCKQWSENGDLIAEGTFKDGKPWTGTFVFTKEHGSRISDWIVEYVEGVPRDNNYPPADHKIP